MIKLSTDIEQSKILGKFLQKESADMGWNLFSDGTARLLPIDDWDLTKDGSGNIEFYPAWSLSALLRLIEWDYNLEKTLFSDLFTYSIGCDDCDDIEYRTYEYDDPLDAAFEMIVWLKENGKI